MTRTSRPGTAGWLTASDCNLDDLLQVVDVSTDAADFPYADEVRDGVLVYGRRLDDAARDSERRRQVQAELVRALTVGPGIVLFSSAFPDTSVVDRASAVFWSVIEAQRATGTAGGDHFAPPGANDRVWGALDKFALRDADAFIDYYGNDVLALVSEAWLGPGYQVTSQVNVVNPGGAAQVAHRDYHLGFMSAQQSLAFPAHVHRLSPALTLQGAVAHCDMPVKTGPTRYLPHSQKYELGYVACHLPEFTAYFDEHFVQLPLRKGDAAFFNPAVLHAAGTNRTSDVRRMANLLQVSSPFGRAMEAVDRTAMCLSLYPALLSRVSAGADVRILRNVVAAAAEGYPFPTDLDQDQPVDGLAPATQADVVHRALAERWSEDALEAELQAQASRRSRAH